MTRTLASLLKEIAQILTDEKDEVSGVMFIAMKKDGSLPAVVAQIDQSDYFAADTVMRYWWLAQDSPGLTMAALWDSRDTIQMNEEIRRMTWERQHPYVCDLLRFGRLRCGGRFKTARGLEMHKRRGYGHREEAR